MSIMKLARPREFKIETYYYKQDQDDQKHRIHFKRLRHTQNVPKFNPIRLIFAILLLMFVIYFLQKNAQVMQAPAEPGSIKVEEIIIVD